jgi:hypothetical protein
MIDSQTISSRLDLNVPESGTRFAGSWCDSDPAGLALDEARIVEDVTRERIVSRVVDYSPRLSEEQREDGAVVAHPIARATGREDSRFLASPTVVLGELNDVGYLEVLRSSCDPVNPSTAAPWTLVAFLRNDHPGSIPSPEPGRTHLGAGREDGPTGNQGQSLQPTSCTHNVLDQLRARPLRKQGA